MALQLSNKIGIKEGVQHVRLGEGIVFTIDITPVTSGTPTGMAVTVTRQSDETDVTGTIMPTGSPSYAAGNISLPKFDATGSPPLGRYVIDVQFSVTGEAWSPAIFPVHVRIFE